MPSTHPLAGDPGSSHCREFFPAPKPADYSLSLQSRFTQYPLQPAFLISPSGIQRFLNNTAIASYAGGSLVLMATLCPMSWSAVNLDMSLSLHPHPLNTKAFKGKHQVLPTFSNWPVSRKFKGLVRVGFTEWSCVQQ